MSRLRIRMINLFQAILVILLIMNILEKNVDKQSTSATTEDPAGHRANANRDKQICNPVRSGWNTSQSYHEWRDTNNEESECFIGILIWMSLCYFPSIESYWSKGVLYDNKIKNLLPSSRLELLLKSWHFHNNEQKMSPLANLLIRNFQKSNVP